MSTALNGKLVTVFGGSGFIGRHAIQALARRGYRIRAAVRRPDLATHLQPLGAPGQIMPIQANLRHRWSVDRAVEGADVVVNAVGILAPVGKQSFEAIQSDSGLAKVSVIGIGMRSHAGVAATAFSALAAKGVNIRAITTSEIKFSLLIDADYTELAVRALHSVYDLNQN